MQAKLTEEQRSAMAAHPGVPIPIIDDDTEQTYYLISERSLTHLENAANLASESSRQRLQKLIEEGDATESIPSEVVFADLRKRAAQTMHRPQ